MIRLTWTQDGETEIARAGDEVVFTIAPHTGPAHLLTCVSSGFTWAHNDSDHLADMATEVWRDKVARRAGNPDPRATLLLVAEVLAEVTAERYRESVFALQHLEGIVAQGLIAAGVTEAPCETCGDGGAPLVVDPYLVAVAEYSQDKARRYLCGPCVSARADEI